MNPEVVETGDEVETDDEGCLSLQGVLVPVERATRVVVAAKDPQGGTSGWSSTTSPRASCSTSSTTSTAC